MIQHSESGLGRTREFGGRAAPQQPGQYEAPHYQQQTNFANRLAAQIKANSGAMSSANGGVSGDGEFKGFSYNKKKNEGLFGNMFNGEETLTDEQFRIEAIDQATRQGGALYSILHNRQGAPYQATKNAMQRFKIDRYKNVDPIYEAFITEVEGNLSLYRYIASVASALFSCDLVTLLMSGTLNGLDADNQRKLQLIDADFFDVLVLQFTSWLENHPDAASIVSLMSPNHHRTMSMIDENIGVLQNKILTISVGSTEFPFPWKKGFMQRISERTHARNPLLDNIDFEYNNEGIGTIGSYFDTPTMDRGPSVSGQQETIDDVITQLAKGNSNNPFVEKSSGSSFLDSIKVDPSYSGKRPHTDGWGNIISEEEHYASMITSENFDTYNVNDYFVKVPGPIDNLYIAQPRVFHQLCRVLELKNSENDPKRPYSFVSDCIDVLPLIRLDWENRCYDYTNVPIEGTVDMYLTNPELVLPLLEPSDEVAKFTNFEDCVKELNELVDKENKPITMEDTVKMTDKPRMLFGNQPFEASSNDEVISSVEGLATYYDPNDKLDAFALPVKSEKMIQLPKSLTAEAVYKMFPSLVNGRCNDVSMDNFVRSIKNGISKLDPGSSLVNTIKVHLTDVVNRWLVECRFYDETKEGGGHYLKLDDLIDEHDKFLAFLLEKDEETALAYMNLVKNDFLKENLTLFSTKEDREAVVQRELEKQPEEMKEVKKALYDSSMLIHRDLMVVRVNPLRPFSTYERVILKESRYPAFDAIYKSCELKMEKHFDRKVSLLVTFGSDVNGRVWVVTRSEFDKGVYTFRPISTMTNIELLKIAK